MTIQDHRVPVDNGKYTFINRHAEARIDVLRHGQPWVDDAVPAAAISGMMCEFDAARVVVQAARAVAAARDTSWSAEVDARVGLVRALAQHDALTSDRTPPSEWCGAATAEAETEKCPRCMFTPCRRMFQCADDLDLEIQMMEAEGNTGERWQRGLAWLRELRDRRAAGQTTISTDTKR